MIIWLTLVFVYLYFCCSSKEINKTTVDGLTYLGRKNINRTKPESIEINTLERRKNTTYFNITEQRTDNEQTYANNVFFVWSPMIVGAVVTPVTLSILYVLFRFCKLTKFSQNLCVEDEEQRNFLHSKQATKMMFSACDWHFAMHNHYKTSFFTFKLPFTHNLTLFNCGLLVIDVELAYL